MSMQIRPQGGKAASRQAKRHRVIVDAVMDAGSISIEDLAALLDVSVMTVHRDLDELESQNIVRKSRGAATALPSSAVESNDAYRRGQQREEKAELAHAALEFVQQGQTVMLDDSTTLLPLLDILPARAPLTVASNSLSVINGLATKEGIQMVSVGGEYVSWCNAFMGQMATDAIDALQVDLLIMSTSAVIGGACYHQRQDTVSVKRAMMRAAATTVLLLDHTKFERRAMFELCDLTAFDHIIVDSKTSQNVITSLVDRGIDVTTSQPIG